MKQSITKLRDEINHLNQQKDKQLITIQQNRSEIDKLNKTKSTLKKKR